MGGFVKRILGLCVLVSVQCWAAEVVESAPLNNGFFDQVEITQQLPVERSVNFRVNPVMIGVGAWNVDVDFAVNNWLTLGPTFTYYLGNKRVTVFSGETIISDERSKFGGYNFGVRANLYISGQRFTDGWILAPYAGIVPGTASFNRNGKEFEGKFTGVIAGLVFSHQWIWASGLNLTVGAGFAYVGLPENTAVTSKNGDGEIATASIMETMPFRRGKLLPSFDLTLGFAL
jgi:hypothetical protein